MINFQSRLGLKHVEFTRCEKLQYYLMAIIVEYDFSNRFVFVKLS